MDHERWAQLLMRRATLLRLAGRLHRDRSGLALMEFAFTLPLVIGLGMYSIETANLALVNLRISQIALNLADNASRVGLNTGATEQLREVDMNDVLQAARYQGRSINLTTQGRITVSSLENVQQSYDAAPVQRIHWQRCIGLNSGTTYASLYPVAASAGSDATQANAGTAYPNGVGDPGGAKVNAPSNAGLIYVEVNYSYNPIVSGWLLTGSQRIHYIASFLVRDNRDFSRMFNPSPTSTPSTCNNYTS